MEHFSKEDTIWQELVRLLSIMKNNNHRLKEALYIGSDMFEKANLRKDTASFTACLNFTVTIFHSLVDAMDVTESARRFLEGTDWSRDAVNELSDILCDVWSYDFYTLLYDVVDKINHLEECGYNKLILGESLEYDLTIRYPSEHLVERYNIALHSVRSKLPCLRESMKCIKETRNEGQYEDLAASYSLAAIFSVDGFAEEQFRTVTEGKERLVYLMQVLADLAESEEYLKSYKSGILFRGFRGVEPSLFRLGDLHHLAVHLADYGYTLPNAREFESCVIQDLLSGRI